MQVLLSLQIECMLVEHCSFYMPVQYGLPRRLQFPSNSMSSMFPRMIDGTDGVSPGPLPSVRTGALPLLHFLALCSASVVFAVSLSSTLGSLFWSFASRSMAILIFYALVLIWQTLLMAFFFFIPSMAYRLAFLGSDPAPGLRILWSGSVCTSKACSSSY